MTLTKTFLIVFGLIAIIVGCSNSQMSGSQANFTEPKLIVKQQTIMKSDPGGGYSQTVKLPLMVWSSFDYRDVADLRGAVDVKLNYCVINETDGIFVKLDTAIEFIEDATCFHTFFTSADGVPHKYIIGLVKVKLQETGEEVWTWSKAVQISK